MNNETSPSPLFAYPSARRLASIEPFYVMELVKEADKLAAAGGSIIHLSIGEPDFGPPAPVIAALTDAVGRGKTGYTPAVGHEALRKAIAARYRSVHDLDVSPSRIVITAGASGALLLAVASLLDQDQEVLIPDPSYPCNRHIVTSLGARTRSIPCGPKTRFQLGAAEVEANWTANTRGVLLASPANPTGITIPAKQLAEVLEVVRQRHGFLIVDEIYNDLLYGPPARTALALGEDVVVVNSFSKYFGMTGWRLGWLVVPEYLILAVEKLAQNLFICASAPAQQAALACFEPPSLAICESRRLEFQARRDFLIPALRKLGFGIPVEPDGAFYIYANVERFGLPSDQLAHRMLHKAGVCCVPGRDFGNNSPEKWMRFSYATSLELLHSAVHRMDDVLSRMRT